MKIGFKKDKKQQTFIFELSEQKMQYKDGRKRNFQKLTGRNWKIFGTCMFSDERQQHYYQK